jgi:hypothetical protein
MIYTSDMPSVTTRQPDDVWEETMSYRNSSKKFVIAAALIVTMAGAQRADGATADGVVLIDQSRALAGSVTPGDAPGFPITISVPGTYRLTSNLAVGAGPVIEIAADEVTIDLDGFSISAQSGARTVAILSPTNSPHTNLTIRNGTIAGFSFAVFLNNSRFVSIGRLRVHRSRQGRGATILVGDNASIIDNNIFDNSSAGIQAGMASLITGNFVFGNGADGINAGSGSLISGNTVFSNGGNNVRHIYKWINHH